MIKKPIFIGVTIFFLSISSIWSQCNIDACAADIMIEACDETNSNVQNNTGLAYSNSNIIISFNLFTNSVIVNAACLDNLDVVFFYVDGPVNDLGGCPHSEFIRTFFIEELGAQIATCDQIITLVDTFTPTINCPNGGITIIEIDNFSGCGSSSSEIISTTGFPFSNAAVLLTEPEDFVSVSTGGTYDDSGCEIVELIYIDTDDGIECPNQNKIGFQFTRTWTITDVCGNVASCDEIVQLIDVEGPILIGGVDFFISQDPNGFEYTHVNCPIIFSWDVPTEADFENNCGMDIIVTQVTGPAPGNEINGNTTVCYNFRDTCGNISELVCFDITCFQCMGTGVPPQDCNWGPLCNIGEANGFQSCLIGSGATETLCDTGGIQNANYTPFFAAKDSINISIVVLGCAPGDNGELGLQANVTDICDASTCYGNSGANCEQDTLDFTAYGLIIGNVYQLVIDGCGGAVCNYSISLDPDQTFKIPEPSNLEINVITTPIDCIQAPEIISFCPGSSLEFYPQNLDGAEFFFCWSIDNNVGVSVGNHDNNCIDPSNSFNCSSDFSTCGPLELTFAQAGTYVICLDEMSNGCDTSQPPNYCFNVEIGESFSECSLATLTPSRPEYPTSSVNGPYCPGEVVNFCYDLNFMVDSAGEGNNCQWLQGLVPSIGGGWDVAAKPLNISGPEMGAQWLETGSVNYQTSISNFSTVDNCAGNPSLTTGEGAVLVLLYQVDGGGLQMEVVPIA